MLLKIKIPSTLIQIPGEEETIPEQVNRQKATILDNIHVMETSRTLGNPLQLTGYSLQNRHLNELLLNR
jgi:surfactin synthase thioesterase subunit